MKRPILGVRALLPAAALILAAFANLAFFRNTIIAFADAPGGPWHVASTGLVLFLLLVLALSVLCWRRWSKPVLILFFLAASVAAYFMDVYNTMIDDDMIANVMATDTAEVMDIISPRLFAYVALLGLLPSTALLWLRIGPERFSQALKTRLLLGGGALAGIAALVAASSPFYASFIREHKPLKYFMNPVAPLYAVYDYAHSSASLQAATIQPIENDAHIPPEDVDRELVIMVVGETAREDRFSINGYERPTTPLLERENLFSFRDVTACGTSTAVAVPCMFAMNGRKTHSRDTANHHHNVLDVLEHAGVHILWRDNNSDSKGVADRIPTEDFRSPDLNPVCDEECRDEGMLDGLQEFVDGFPDGDLLIVLHQMGSHGPAYYKRYPEAFRRFTPTCDTNELQECTREEINNAYDNSILYTDYFLSRVIDFLRGNDDRFETAMLYVGDHGESLGEHGLYLHGAPFMLAPDDQTRVPMIFWFGRNYHDADRQAMAAMREQPFSHDNVFHTLLGFFEVESKVYAGEMDLLQRSRSLSAGRSAGVVQNRESVPGPG